MKHKERLVFRASVVNTEDRSLTLGEDGGPACSARVMADNVSTPHRPIEKLQSLPCLIGREHSQETHRNGPSGLCTSVVAAVKAWSRVSSTMEWIFGCCKAVGCRKSNVHDRLKTEDADDNGEICLPSRFTGGQARRILTHIPALFPHTKFTTSCLKLIRLLRWHG